MAGTRKSSSSPVEDKNRKQARIGLVCGLGAYVIWGFVPVYFRALAHVPSTVVVCHRIVWSAVFMAFVVTSRREWKPVMAAVNTWRSLFLLTIAAVLIAINWLVFIYAVATQQLLQASLGYFINPLLSIALGMVFLGERLRVGQWVAVAIAALAVANLAGRAAGFPWIALSLAGSFGFYGLIRKKLAINAVHALLVESVVLVPFALVALVSLPAISVSSGTWGLLSLAGVITAIPLLCFGAAVRRLKLSTMGFLQYTGPTLQFLVATFLFREPLDAVKLVSFVLCWMAIAVYIADSIANRAPQPVADEPD